MRLKELREEKNLSQNEVAQAIQTSQTNIGRWEKGLNEPSANYIIKLANYFECSTDYLLDREDDFGNITIKNAAPALSDEERRLVELYRSLPRYLQESAYAELKGMSIAVSTTNKRNNKNT
jgi:transcriptional regulator with XRE-family HTH domain